MTTTPLAGDTQLVSDASGQIRLEQDENQSAAPETPAAPDCHDEDSLPGNPPVGGSEQESHGDNEANPPDDSGDSDQNGEDEESSQDDTPPATNEDAGQGDDGASQDPLGLSEAETEELESELEKIGEMDLDELADALKKSHQDTVQSNLQVVNLSMQAIIDGWKNGRILNRAKELNPKKGEFSTWRKKEVVDSGLMSERTAQRYMKLASKCPSLDELLKSTTSLRKAYQKLGILPSDQMADCEGVGQSSGKRSDLESLMKGLLDSQKILRTLVPKVCGEGKPELQPEQVVQLRLIRTEIDGFIAKLLGETVGEIEPGDPESGNAQDVGKPEEGSGDDPPSDPPAPGANAKSKGGSETHLAMGQAEPGSKKSASGKAKSGKSQPPGTASK